MKLQRYSQGVAVRVGGVRMAVVALCTGVLLSNAAVTTAANTAPPTAEPLATVGDAVITVQEYAIALRTEAKRKFYHAQPSEREMVAFQREVADHLIERQLALQEARRRGVRIDTKEIETRVRAHQEKVRGRDGARDDKAFWTALRREMESEQLVRALRDQVRADLTVSDAAVLAYYQGHRDKFTEPERMRLSALLLRVAPSSGQGVWNAAMEEAQKLSKQLGEGAAFDELARMHSGDGSASKGGDLGYVHKGMLGQAVEDAVAGLSPGQVSEPITVLEGVALFKLHERRAAQLSDFAQVKGRARELLQKESEEKAWRDLIARLRAGTSIKVQEKYLTPS